MARTGGLLWRFGQTLYEAVTKHRPSEDEVGTFMNVCPPFRAAVYGWIVLPWYDRCIRIPDRGPSLDAERNDMMMSVYLPYCERFVTAERKATQERCLGEVVQATNIPYEVVSYEDFCGSFIIVGMSPTCRV